MPTRTKLMPLVLVLLVLASCSGDSDSESSPMGGVGGQAGNAAAASGAGGIGGGGGAAGSAGTQGGIGGSAGTGGLGGAGGESADAGPDANDLTDAATDDAALPDAEGWVTTWGTALVDFGVFIALPDDVTVRQIMRVSVGGERLRVRFSNRFGTTPLVLGAAHVALRGVGSSIVAGSDHALTFDGESTLELPAGQDQMSDPIELELEALADVAISIDLPQATIAQTLHVTSIQTTYTSDTAGSAGDTQLVGVSEGVAWAFVDGIDVVNARPHAAIVAFGDSITDGWMSTDNANKRWPDELARRLVAADMPFSVVNEGYSGNQVLADGNGESALKRFERDVLGNAGVTHVIVLEGINDIGLSGATAEAIIAGYEQLIEMAHDAGLKIIFGTICPFEGAAYYSEYGEAARTAVNAWIRTHGDRFDGMIDFDAATRDPSSTKQLLPAYDSGDFLHPSDAGYVAMGQAVDLALFD